MAKPAEPPAWERLEMSGAELRQALDRVAGELAAFLDAMPARPASRLDGGEALAEALVEAAPADGAPLDELLRTLFDRAISRGFENPGPGFLAFIPGGGLPAAALGDLVAGIVNRYVTVWQAAPGAAQLEANVVRWFSDLVGYPPSGGGFLTSGGSLANFSAVVAARERHLGEDFSRGTVYASDQIHHSVDKAARLAGVPPSRLRKIGSDARQRIRLDRLREAIRADRDAGDEPFLVVGSAGTTNTGAIDDLEGLAELAAGERLWLHVDAAYGGFFALTERGRERMRGLGGADSVTLDPHKGLFLPYGTGCLLARDVRALHDAHAQNAAYMPASTDAGGRIDFCQISPELSRDFRGLRVWLALRLHGLEAFRSALDEKLDLTEHAHRELEKIPGIEIVGPPELSVVAFRLEPPGVAGEALDRLNRELLDRVNARRRVYLTGTVLDRGFVLRICVLCFRTHLEHVDRALGDLREAVADLLAGAPAGAGTDSGSAPPGA